LQLALGGCVLPHHRWLLREMIEDLDHVGAKITRIEETIEQQMRPFQEAVNRWLTVPGIKHRLAWTLVAEVGPTVDAFPSAADIVSWAGVCPRQQPDRRQTKERHHARR
jgi:transposase